MYSNFPAIIGLEIAVFRAECALLSGKAAPPECGWHSDRPRMATFLQSACTWFAFLNLMLLVTPRTR
jgi:hypothetical protein